MVTAIRDTRPRCAVCKGFLRATKSGIEPCPQCLARATIADQPALRGFGDDIDSRFPRVNRDGAR